MEDEPVLLDLNAIASQPGAKGTFAYSLLLPASEGLVCEGAIEVSLEVQNTAKALLVRGSFRGKVRLCCARCLEETVEAVGGKIHEEFSLPGISAPELGLIDQVEPREAAFAEQVLNVSELVRQQLLSSLPLRALCRADCKGLCPRCGQNLNRGKCQCAETEVAPGWEALRDLMEEGKE